jgi:hypothetical protein
MRFVTILAISIVFLAIVGGAAESGSAIAESHLIQSLFQ